MPVPESWKFRDRRDADQLAKDKVSVRHQVDELHPDNTEELEKIIQRIHDRVDHSDRDDIKFDKYPSGGRWATSAHVAKNQLVVNMASAGKSRDDVIGILGRRASFRVPAPDPNAADPDALVVGVAANSTDDLANAIESLKDDGVEAGFNVIVPLGHVIKGDDFATQTRNPGDFPLPEMRDDTLAAGTPVHVVIVDTGTTPEVRTDRWLARVPKGPNDMDVDPLDILPLNPNPDGRLDYFAGHGTFVAGIVEQIAPQCKIFVYRFTAADGIGTEKHVADTLLRALDATHRNAHLIINLSVGVREVDGYAPVALRRAIKTVQTARPDAVIVAAGGNSGDGAPMYPADFAGVVGVGALTADYKEAKFSNRSDKYIDFSTVGVGVSSTFVPGLMPPFKPINENDNYTFPPGDAWGVWSGTSFSAPQIAAAIARICYEDSLSPKDALGALEKMGAKDPGLPGFGIIIKGLLPGTLV